MRRKWIFSLAATLIASFCAILFLRSAIAGGAGTVGKAQFRSTLPSGTINPVGTLTVTENGGQQVLHVQVQNVEVTDLSIYLSPTNSFVGTNAPAFMVAPLFRNNIKNGSWFRKLTGTGGAPPEFQLLGVANLSDLSGLQSIVLGNPGVTNIIGGTNLIDCVQTSTNGVTVTTCTTNIVGGTTNILINSFAWAPVPPIVADPSALGFHASFAFQQPPVPPDPHARGKVRLSYNGSSGRSLLDISLNGLIPGQHYALSLSDGGSNFIANTFSLSTGGSKGQGEVARLRLDTGRGDSLPIQVPSTADLTDRVFSVRDGTGFIYLTGSLP